MHTSPCLTCSLGSLLTLNAATKVFGSGSGCWRNLDRRRHRPLPVFSEKFHERTEALFNWKEGGWDKNGNSVLKENYNNLRSLPWGDPINFMCVPTLKKNAFHTQTLENLMGIVLSAQVPWCNLKLWSYPLIFVLSLLTWPAACIQALIFIQPLFT